MKARLQRRVQRYGWDLAADDYEPLWQAQLSTAQAAVMRLAAPAAGERLLDVACGTGLIAFAAAEAVGAKGAVIGIDLSGRMVEASTDRARRRSVGHAQFVRMDAEELAFPAASFDVVVCGLGLMYMPDAERAVREMRRVLRPGGRMAAAVWGDRAACGWSSVFDIVDAEVASDVCPLFFRLGAPGALARACTDAGLRVTGEERLSVSLPYDNSVQACDAAFVGGPVALAWSRFDAAARNRARARYAETIAPWRAGTGYRIPGEFVIVSALTAD